MFKKNVEIYIYYIVLILSLFPFFSLNFFPTLDGPSHLYNSTIINKLLFENTTFLHNYYEINYIFIPNWTSHFVLSFFNLFLPANIAEKSLLIFYVLGLNLSFRALLKSIPSVNIILSYLILPFTFSFLFHLGFYNYCISFIFMFLSIRNWIKILNTFKLKLFILQIILLTFTYYSNILTFAFLGITLFFITLAFKLKDDKIQFSIKIFIKECIILLITALPALILSYFFITTVTFFESNKLYSIKELYKWINDVRPLIVFDYEKDLIFTQQIFHILFVLIVLSIFVRITNINNNNIKLSIKNVFNYTDILLIPIIITLILYFKVPDNASAGMMSDRLCLLFFILLIIWISFQHIPKWISYILMFFIISLHFTLLYKHYPVYKSLNKDATEIYNTRKYIKDGTILLPVNMTDNWLQSHFSNYCGLNKSVVMLDNYEADVNWFPIKWKKDNLTQIVLDNRNNLGNIINKVDYILLYGNTNMIENVKWNDLKVILTDKYKLIYSLDSKYIALYERKL